MIACFIWITWTLMSAVRKRPFDLITHSLGLSRSNCEIAVSQEWVGRLNGMKGMWVDRFLDPLCDLDLTHDLGLRFSRLNFHSNSLISGIGGWIDLERKGWKSAMRVNWLGMKGMWVHYDVGPFMQPWTHNMGLPVGYGTYQIQWPSNGLMHCKTVIVSNLWAH